MDAADLLAAYPTVQTAIAWVERFVMTPYPCDPGKTPWDYMTADNRSPLVVLALLMGGTTAELDWGDLDIRQVREEMGRPEFATYVAGRMGAC